jgi:hypothetical protein
MRPWLLASSASLWRIGQGRLKSSFLLACYLNSATSFASFTAHPAEEACGQMTDGLSVGVWLQSSGVQYRSTPLVNALLALNSALR